MKNLNKIYFFTFLAIFIPSVSFAFTLLGSNFKAIITEVMGIINLLVPILTSVAFVVFFWGLSKFILNSNKPEEIKNGKSYMMWGVLVLFILLTFRVIVGFVSNELEIGGTTPVIPILRTS